MTGFITVQPGFGVGRSHLFLVWATAGKSVFLRSTEGFLPFFYLNPYTLRYTIESGCCVVLEGFKNNSKKPRFPQFMYLLGKPIIVPCGPGRSLKVVNVITVLVEPVPGIHTHN